MWLLTKQWRQKAQLKFEASEAAAIIVFGKQKVYKESPQLIDRTLWPITITLFFEKDLVEENTISK